MFVLAHKWHGEKYFSIKYFVGLLPESMRASLKGAKSSMPLARLLPQRLLSRAGGPPPCSPLEISLIEEPFLTLIGLNATVPAAHGLRLMDYFLMADEREALLGYMGDGAVKKMFLP